MRCSEGFGSLSIAELQAMYRQGTVSVSEVIESVLRHVERDDPKIGAFVTVLDGQACERAAQLDKQLHAGDERGPLFGVPIAVKDLGDYGRGVPTTFGTCVLRNFIPHAPSLYVARLEAAGAVVIGKTNVPEFGHKGVTDNSLVGPARLPSDPTLNAGGSSGGSAAAVAAGFVPVAQGSDGGGSVRIPAALCGLVGIKPTFGRVADPVRPNAFVGTRPYVGVGPLARNVADATVMLEAMSGVDARDPWSYRPNGPLSEGGRGARGTRPDGRAWRVAYASSFGDFPVEPEVAAATDELARRLEESGVEVEHVAIPLGFSHNELCEVWMREMGMSYLAVMDGLNDLGHPIYPERASELAPELVSMLDRAENMSVKQVRNDDRIRTIVLDHVEDAFEGFDFLMTPTLGVAAIQNASNGHTLGPASVAGVSVNPSLGWALTYPFNFTGHPSASYPIKWEAVGNVGVQVTAPRFGDGELMAFGSLLETMQT